MNIFHFVLGGGSTPIPKGESVKITLTQVGGSNSDLMGATITVTNLDTLEVILYTSWAGGAITTDIDGGTNYRVTVGNISGYITPSSKEYMSGFDRTNEIRFQYCVNGLYIYSNDRILYTNSEWISAVNAGVYDNSDASGVAVISSNVRFVVGPWIALPVGPNSDASYNTKWASNPQNDYDCHKNTTDFILSYNLVSTSYAPVSARTYTFADGYNGDLMAWGQWMIVYNNKSTFNTLATTIGLQTFDEGWTKTSTYYGYNTSNNGFYACWGNYTGHGSGHNRFPIAESNPIRIVHVLDL